MDGSINRLVGSPEENLPEKCRWVGIVGMSLTDTGWVVN
jgi:hypothetical protein